jgi:hypothetical protein
MGRFLFPPVLTKSELKNSFVKVDPAPGIQIEVVPAISLTGLWKMYLIRAYRNSTEKNA